MNSTKLSETLEKYLLSVSIQKKGYEQEKFRIKQIKNSFLGSMLTSEIKSVDIASYRDARLDSLNAKTQKKISPATVKLELSLLSNVFDIARIEWGHCTDNPVKNVRKPKTPPGRDRRVTAREERQILRYCHAHTNVEIYSIVSFALETAMRQSEILNLRWENVNLSSRIASLPETKNGTKRDVPLSLHARDMLTRLTPKSSGRIFSYTANGLKSTWRFMLQRLEIDDLHFHDLRHEAISRLFEKGTLDMMEIAAISGHKSLSMLKRYTHLKASHLVKKMEMPKNKAKAALLSKLIPYPAIVKVEKNRVVVRMLDFENLEVDGCDLKSAIPLAQDKLLRHLMNEIKGSRNIPRPDQYLEPVPAEQLVMIDPLPSTEN